MVNRTMIGREIIIHVLLSICVVFNTVCIRLEYLY